jgi:hypothetical protein
MTGRWYRFGAICLALMLGPPMAGAAWAQSGQASSSAAASGPAWKDLTSAQRTALKPLEREWASIDAERKRKWLEIAGRFPSMNPPERARLQERMTEWVRLSPEARRTARLNFREAKDVSPQERRSSWEAYQALSDEERQRLAQQAARAQENQKNRARRSASSAKQGSQQAQSRSQAKSNVAPNPTFASQPKPVAPVILQARPGATTTSISKRPAPPWHQQPGMPKIAATPEFVDSHTLLPKVGPQAVEPFPPAPAASRK